MFEGFCTFVLIFTLTQNNDSIMNYKLWLTIIFITAFYFDLSSCTTAVISGKHTADGRPILWKVRDTDYLDNCVKYFDDGEFKYVGLLNSSDTNCTQIWAGSNNFGFAIMNSASFNVNIGDTSDSNDYEGVFMKKALMRCKNLSDFEALLESEKRPMGLAAHFGVIDAEGGAAFYEVNNYTFTKFDANDINTAPNGYIIRTNYSFTGKENVGYGYVRYKIASINFDAVNSTAELTPKYLIQTATRSFINPMLDVDYRKEFSNRPYTETFVSSDDLTSRIGTASNVVIKGVKPSDDKEMSVMWTNVGFPNTCVSFPVIVKHGESLPDILLCKNNKNSALNEWSKELKKKCYPIVTVEKPKYLKISELFNSENTGIIQKIEVIEEGIFAETNSLMDKWYNAPPNKGEMEKLYSNIENKIVEFYKN